MRGIVSLENMTVINTINNRQFCFKKIKNIVYITIIIGIGVSGSHHALIGEGVCQSKRWASKTAKQNSGRVEADFYWHELH